MFEENRPLRKPLAAVLVVVWLVLSSSQRRSLRGIEMG